MWNCWRSHTSQMSCWLLIWPVVDKTDHLALTRAKFLICSVLAQYISVHNVHCHSMVNQMTNQQSMTDQQPLTDQPISTTDQLTDQSIRPTTDQSTCPQINISKRASTLTSRLPLMSSRCKWQTWSICICRSCPPLSCLAAVCHWPNGTLLH